MRQDQLLDDLEDSMRQFVGSMMRESQTALIGRIEKFYPDGTAQIQPFIQANYKDQTGATVWTTLPLIDKVPCFFAGDNNFVITTPVTEGASCLVVIASRCIEGWWQSNEISIQQETRVNHLQDAFALVGFRPQAFPIPDFNTNAIEIRTMDGSSKISVRPSGQIVITGNVLVNGTITATGSITAPDFVTAGGLNPGIRMATHRHEVPTLDSTLIPEN